MKIKLLFFVFLSFFAIKMNAQCSGSPTGGTANASNLTPLIGSNVQFSLTGASSGSGILYQWQESPYASYPFTDIVGATSSTYAENCYAYKCYRCVVTCTNSNLWDTSSMVCVNALTAAQMCKPEWTYTVGANGLYSFSPVFNFSGTNYTWTCNNVVFGTTANCTYQFPANGIYTICLNINNPSISCTDDSCLTVVVNNINTTPCQAALAYSVDPSSGYVTFASTGSFSSSMFYHWYLNGTAVTTGQTSGMFLPNGNYTLCLAIHDTVNNCNDSTCQTITVAGSPICNSTPTAGVAVASNTTPVYGSNVQFSLTGASLGNGVTYQWQHAISASAPFSNIAGANFASYSENSYSNQCYRCVVTCSFSNLSDTSSIVCVTPTPTSSLCNAIFGYSIGSNGLYNFSTLLNYSGTNYTWTCNNVVFGTTTNSTYQFAANGIYTICLNVNNPSNSCNVDSCITLVVNNMNTAPCQAAFAYSLGQNGSVLLASTGSFSSSMTYQWYANGVAIANGQTAGIYLPNGTHTVCLAIHDTINNCSDSICQTLTVTGSLVCNSTPTAGPAVASNYTPSVGGNVQFALNASSWGFGTTYQWQHAVNATSIFSDIPGAVYMTYSENCYTNQCYRCVVTCTYSNLSDTSSIVCITPTIPIPTPCNANFNYNIGINGNIYLQSTSTNTPSSTTYTWSCNNVVIGSGTSCIYQFPANGAYTICLHIADSLNSCSDDTCLIITNNCQANYFVYPDTNGAPHTYIGVNTSTGTGLSYLWIWGDGTTSTGAYPSHTYPAGGTYQLCLVVSSVNCTDTFCAPQAILKTTGPADPYTINFANPSGIKNVTNDIASIYPNPTNGNITIKGIINATYQVELLNLNGSVINKYSVTNSQNINIATLKPAVYILKISDDKGNHQYTKLIKE